MLRSCQMRKLITKETEEILSVANTKSQIVTEGCIVDLPICVQKWIVSTGIIEKPAIKKNLDKAKCVNENEARSKVLA